MRKASRHPTLSSMANSGCLLLSGSGMLPHSLQCPPAFLYLPEVRLEEARFVAPPPLLSPSLHPFIPPCAPRQHVMASLCVLSTFTPPFLTLDPHLSLRGGEKSGRLTSLIFILSTILFFISSHPPPPLLLLLLSFGVIFKQ